MGNMHYGIRVASACDYEVLVAVWERSVLATHHFLAQEDFYAIKRLLPTVYLPSVVIYVVTVDGKIVGFIGLSIPNIEMLFVDDGYQGCGLGSALLNLALEHGATSVDVNEQNQSALQFYLSKGFRVVGRDDTDGDGRPYPILHLSR